MSIAVKTPPGHLRLHRAPLLDPPFDDELSPSTYRPVPYEPQSLLPTAALVGASCECHTAALRFLNLCLELFNGFRSPAQMRPLIGVEHALPILDELARGLRVVTEMRRRRPGADSRVRRSQVRTCEPRPGVAEVTAILKDGTRTWALAYRLELHSTTHLWKCVVLKVLL